MEEHENFRSGCFQATNHGMASSFLDEIRGVAKEFFQLPMEEKHKCGRAVGDIQGYGTDIVITDDQTLDWIDRLYLYLFSEDERKPNLWPQIPETFRNVLDEYAARMKIVYETVLRVLLKKLKSHADGSGITVVLPDDEDEDEVEGLQFLRDGHWFRVHTSHMRSPQMGF